MSQVSIKAAVTPVVSYAMAHNRISPIQSIEITNQGVARQGAELLVAVVDSQGALSRPWNRRVDLAAGASVSVTDVSIALAPEAMQLVEEARPGVVRISVSHDGEVLAHTELDVQVLAGNQWLSQPPGLAVELLAAHVMPNAPQITALMPRVAELVGATTGRPVLDGYQSEDPGRVDALVAAAFGALQERSIHYAEPPASWADAGQKIRTPAEVIDGRLGTCLDTCVVMAAVLEQIGIHPQIWILNGHAVLGYWRTTSEAGSVTYDPSELMNLLDLGYLKVVETTLIPDAHATFESALDAGWRKVHSGLSEALWVLDVFAARQNRILPLPAITRQGDAVQVVEYRPMEHSVAPSEREPARLQASSAVSATGRPVPVRVQQWKNALLDLGLRNRLINFTPRSAVHLHTDAASLHALEDDLNGHRLVTLRPADDIPEALKAQFGRTAADLPAQVLGEYYRSQRAAFTDLGAATYLSRLRSLAYKARTVQEETGANNLYLAFGSLVWELDGRQLRSPLVLAPITLKAGRGRGLYQITGDEAGQSTPNYCLLERLRQDFGLNVPGLENPAQDSSGIDLQAAFDALRQALAARGLPFHVEDTADIAVLQFAKYRLWKDIDESWEQLLAAPLVKHLALTPTDEFVDPARPEVDHPLEALAAKSPIPADGSQLTAIAEALGGRTFVLEGPPGTGKSQTIANLLAHSIASGKKVLFVAEKRAALDVVSSRVNEIGLGAFTLDLHDKLSRPSAVRRQIAAALDLTARGDLEGLHAQWDVMSSAGGVLERYAKRLHAPNAAGLSMYSAETQRLARTEDVDVALQVPEHLVQSGNDSVIEQLRQLMRRLPEVADPALPSVDAPWFFVQADHTDAIDYEAVGATARSLDDVAAQLDERAPLGSAARAVTHPEEASILAWFARWRPELALLDEVRAPRWSEAVSRVLREIDQLDTLRPKLAPATAAILDLPLIDLQARAREAAASSFFGRRKRQLAVIADMSAGLPQGPSLVRKELVGHVDRWVELQQHVRRLAAAVNAIPGIRIPEDWNPYSGQGRSLIDDQVAALRQQADAVDANHRPGRFTAALREFLTAPRAVEGAELRAVEAFAGGLAALSKQTLTSGEEIARWSTVEGFLSRWVRTAGRRGLNDPSTRSLVRWVRLREHLRPLVLHGLGAAHNAILTGQISSDQANLALERGLAEASLKERRQSQGLDAFDPVSHGRTVRRYVEASSHVRSALQGVLPLEAVARRTFDHQATAGQVGKLKRELNRQRGGLSVRELMSQFGRLITEIMPCVLVSPDSVARFLPVGSQVFDIVVFDEASQIRVADAVGAIGRGRSVVVVGDSKQMPPTSFAEVSWRPDQDDEDEAFGSEVVEDEESILSECVQARLRRHWLTWHYRSQDESLIAFSNAHYYDGKLSSFPSPVTTGADRSITGHGISLVRVDGKFLRTGSGKLKRTNPVEAEAVVEEIKQRFAAAPPGTVPSIGVVTFNQQQRAYIEALIRDAGDDRLTEALDSSGASGLFVKNLENVQGDERDVILFSTGFSVNERGVLPLNFGPLNRTGGERRLNVAVTRARRQVILFSSFDPAQLRAEETSSVGIKHLRSYLDIAASGTGTLERAVGRTLNPDRHRDEMVELLRSRGLAVTPDVGLSDFRVDLQLALASAPDTPLVAVLLDGPLWAKRLTVGDRDGMPVDVLERAMRWPVVERVWLPEWLADPAAVADRLEKAARNAKHAEVRQQVAVLEPEDDEPELEPEVRREALLAGPIRAAASAAPVAPAAPRRAPAFDVPARMPPRSAPGNRQAFVPWTPTRLGGVDVLDNLDYYQGARQQVGSVMLYGIKAEGPIHAERLAKLTAAAFDLQRVAGTRVRAILAVAPSNPDSGGFFWPPGVDPLAWPVYRADSDAQRPLEHVSEIELANAMRDLCAEAHGMEQDELWSETLRVFGYKRRTPAFLARLQTAFATGVATNRLVKASDGLILGNGR